MFIQLQTNYWGLRFGGKKERKDKKEPQFAKSFLWFRYSCEQIKVSGRLTSKCFMKNQRDEFDAHGEKNVAASIGEQMKERFWVFNDIIQVP